MSQKQSNTKQRAHVLDEFFQHAEDDNLLTAYDVMDRNARKNRLKDPKRVRLALDTVIELFRRGEFVTDRSEIIGEMSKRKETPESGSQDVFDDLFSYSILVPIRRATGRVDDKLLLHGDVIEWFHNIINRNSGLETESTRLKSVMAFVLHHREHETDRSAREVAQDAWLYSRMSALQGHGSEDSDVVDARLTHEGKLKEDEAPDSKFLLADYHVPESQFGDKYYQYLFEGELAEAVSVQSKRLYKKSMEEHMSTLLTGALYDTGGFWNLERDGEDESERDVLTLDDLRSHLMGLDRLSSPSEIPNKFPKQAIKHETAFEADRTRAATYHAIKRKRMSR